MISATDVIYMRRRQQMFIFSTSAATSPAASLTIVFTDRLRKSVQMFNLVGYGRLGCGKGLGKGNG